MAKTIEEIQIGEYRIYSYTFNQEKTEMYGHLTGDLNPAHMDDEYAANTIFKKRIVHGMFVAGLFSKIFGIDFPGLGSIYIKQSVKFKKPVYFGDTITAKVIVKEVILERNRVIFDTIAMNQDNEIVIEGEAEIMPPKKQVI